MNWIILLLCSLSSAHAFKINKHLNDMLLDDGDVNEAILDSKVGDTKVNYGDEYRDNDDEDEDDDENDDDSDNGDNADGDDGEIDGEGEGEGVEKKDAEKNTKRGLMLACGATRRVHTDCCPVTIATKKTKMQLNCHFVCERQRNPPHCGLKVKRICEHNTIKIIQKSVCKPRRVYKTIQFLLPSVIQ
ncbi:uncharacterized protein LOC130654851 [Hydractinia symbiolongicarpus]|uniref:uncharacterized protein LOC130654851 n=1 Tax=Hydractinia symbiolongicarpus TaxID=13093 RepID=UPI00254C23D9|nr:uncharacterized protein LOC130654851 [Hydractinia symbiolongicarpus]XP_057313477.1 uncharacterized protein LOC130654851 [Hydractinia symbiolongicarpus]